MVKVSKVLHNLYPKITKIENKFMDKPEYTPAGAVPLATGGLLGIGIVSDTCKRFFNTLDDNYFQLKTNPKTNQPYEPDIFQKASANYLFLGDDVIVTAPTGTGKTAIAEYVMTKNLKEGLQTYYTTPLKALSNEKFRDFSKIYGEENVGLLTGDTKINTKAPIVIMTTEVYRNMATSAYFNEDRKLPEKLRTVIFDELQYLGDVDRGGVWETSIMLTPPEVQILSLSATAKNAYEINNWISKIRNEKGLKANIDGNYHPNPSHKPRSMWVDVPSTNRHVPLDIALEHVLPDGSKKPAQKTKKKNSEDFKKALSAKTGLSTYKYLTKNLQNEGKLPAIYFIFSKKDSRGLLKYFEEYGDTLTTKEEQAAIQETIERFKEEDKYLGETLNINAMLKGYSIHNAGMLPVQKELVEELFQRKLLKVAIATETLSAGINMPAKTTVITSIRKPASVGDELGDGKRNLTPNEFHQMAGRAGRRGIDKHGYCLPLSCNKAQTTIIEDLIASPSNNLSSNFRFDFAFVSNYMSKFEGMDEVRNFIAKTFFALGNEHKANTLLKEFKIKRDVLREYDFIKGKELTLKGELLRGINGYEQIPVINFIANKNLEGLNIIELAGILGGMANIEYKDALRSKETIFGIINESETVKEKADELNDEIMQYSDRTADLTPNIKMGVNDKVINHLYEWAKLNSLSDDSRKNWKELYEGELKDTIRDEGTLFKEIMMTVDLAKQMIGICEIGEDYSSLESDKIYYTELKDKLYDVIDLLYKEPVNDN